MIRRDIVMNKYGAEAKGRSIRKDVLEKQLLANVQNEALRDEVVQYTLPRFEKELRKSVKNVDNQMGQIQDIRKFVDSSLKDIHRLLNAGP